MKRKQIDLAISAAFGRQRVEAMLKHSRKAGLQRKNKQLAKHADETFKGGTEGQK